MKALERYRLFCKILASGLLCFEGIFQAYFFPGPMDVINGSIAGLVLYVIWFNKDKEK